MCILVMSVTRYTWHCENKETDVYLKWNLSYLFLKLSFVHHLSSSTQWREYEIKILEARQPQMSVLRMTDSSFLRTYRRRSIRLSLGLRSKWYLNSVLQSLRGVLNASNYGTCLFVSDGIGKITSVTHASVRIDFNRSTFRAWVHLSVRIILFPTRIAYLYITVSDPALGWWTYRSENLELK